MIVVGSETETGRVVHAIFGPESELAIDVCGYHEIDVSRLMEAMPSTDGKMMLRLTRSRNEQATATALRAAKVPCITSFDAKTNQPKDSGPAKRDIQDLATEPMPEPEPGLPEIEPIEDKLGRCEYCGEDKWLVPVDGFRICQQCVRIELGRRVEARV